jgi:hypothetical protein
MRGTHSAQGGNKYIQKYGHKTSKYGTTCETDVCMWEDNIKTDLREIE